MEINKKEVGNRIRLIRQNKGMSMEKFGEMFGATKGNVSVWESGSSLPSNKRVRSMAEISGLTVNEILYGIPEIDIILDKHLYKILNKYIENKRDAFKQEVELLSKSAAEGLLQLIGQGKNLDKTALSNYKNHRKRLESLKKYGETYIDERFHNYTYESYSKDHPNSTPKDFQIYIEYQTEILKEIINNFWEASDISNSPYEWVNDRFTNQIKDELYKISNKAIDENKEYYYVNEVVQPFLDQAAKDFKEYIKENTDIE